MWRLDIEHGLKIFGWRDDNAAHLLNRNQKVVRSDSQPSGVGTGANLSCTFILVHVPYMQGKSKDKTDIPKLKKTA